MSTRIRNLVHKFDYNYGVINDNVSEKFENTTNLEAQAIPPVINLDNRNNKIVETFQRHYRMCYAILTTSKDGDVAKFKTEVKSLTNTEDNQRIAVLMAQLFYLVSELGREENLDEKVNWESEDDVINALKKWGIVDTEVLNIARALHRVKLQIVSTGKRINIFGIDVEQQAIKQFNNCVRKNFVLEAALMPDAHSGYVAPIGSVIKTKKAVVPSWVGYDIGCGMIAVKISDSVNEQHLIQEKSKEIFVQVNRDIPMGVGEHNRNRSEIFLVDKLEVALEKLKKSTTYDDLYQQVDKKSRPNLGTLGSGNHFIEISVSGDETWLVIHSGSRNVGHYTGTYFMKAVSGVNKGYEDTFAIEDDIMRNEYMFYQEYCLEFALLNRMSMALKVENAIRKITNITYDTYQNLWTNKNHNHCIKLGNDIFLHRKGATSSAKGERGVIPGNMKDGCYLVEGLGNEDFLSSSSHGAGRELSRTAARRKVKLDVFKRTMEGIVAPVNKKTIDESPFAYKNLTGVMALQRASVKVVKHLKPIINWKGY